MSRLTKRNATLKVSCKENSTYDCLLEDDCITCDCNNKILEKLAHYEDLEEAGRLIVLPCATDERVWVADGVHEPWRTTYTSITQIVMDMVCGRAIGYTKAEATAKMEELKGENNA